MGRPRTAKHPAAAAPPEQAAAETPPPNGQPTVSKADGVREALAQGLDSPGDIVDFLKSRYGIDMPKQMASSYKAQIRAREAKASGEPTSRQRSHSAPQPTGIPVGFGADIKSIKQLIGTAGSGEQLKDLAGTISALVQKYGVAGLGDLIDAFE